MVYYPEDPMILLFSPIKKLKKMAIAADIEYTADQILDIALTVVRNTCDFEHALGEWEALPPMRKTWDNFKTYSKTLKKTITSDTRPNYATNRVLPCQPPRTTVK